MCLLKTATMFTQDQKIGEVLARILKDPSLGVFFKDYFFFGEEEDIQKRQLVLWQMTFFGETITVRHKFVFQLQVQERVSKRIDVIEFYVSPDQSKFCARRQR